MDHSSCPGPPYVTRAPLSKFPVKRCDSCVGCTLLQLRLLTLPTPNLNHELSPSSLPLPCRSPSNPPAPSPFPVRALTNFLFTSSFSHPRRTFVAPSGPFPQPVKRVFTISNNDANPVAFKVKIKATPPKVYPHSRVPLESRVCSSRFARSFSCTKSNRI